MFSEDNPIYSKVSNAAIDTFVDLGGHTLLRDNNTNFYFFGKDPIGGGQIIFGSRENLDINGLKQLALRLTSSAQVTLVLELILSCTSKSKQTLCAGITTLGSTPQPYEDLGTFEVNGLTEARFIKTLSFKKNQSFTIIIWQRDVGDPITIFSKNDKNWKNILNFSFPLLNPQE
jgi:hypothetical protein